ncbi:hypothetical protein AXF42_Ash003645 [Apostasia shenzhenica]|uniref:Uncharacterized protein n=1 Tax=Apostasia shenzhenica TaxID=1088818 RepID=A0A2I0AHK0_9ASPA|nr:hypothetical protein AXF42_Ash003645 [Apostasia shenzhenica]
MKKKEEEERKTMGITTKPKFNPFQLVSLLHANLYHFKGVKMATRLKYTANHIGHE